MFKTIDDLKQQLDALRPLPKHSVQSLHEALVLEWTYHSNAIEGNTLTLKETKVVLEGITVGGKSMREHFEAINHREAIEWVESVVVKDEPFSERLIKSIHQLVLKNIDDSNAGRYRQENVMIAGAEHTPPDHLHLPMLMAELVQEYQQQDCHPVERAARLHVDFVGIHPFVDGNGRTARLLMNFDLMTSGYLPVIIKTEHRLAYYEALDKAHTTQHYQDYIAMVVAAQEEALNQYLSIVG
ncbi:Fic family protein [Endozoicomonas gorgoniicola]|uniref:Fic family protein n=1 Tax=Endozoicomonas gorgoniicola TaxID=1234144 RepID=A0ABT3MWB2_9GAMM|nr:Fic family protein [Endozoicomonas gorgoniicola]MCW7553676.1 Fic family protein [Endozoicomonas gorgoniicola]